MKQLRKIAGAGGGSGGSSSSAHESSDSLRSRQIASIIDMISEGEIEGLGLDPLSNVYLNGTPVRSVDSHGGSVLNFSGVSVVSRNGTQSQPYISGFSAVENEITVSTQVKQSLSVTRTISNQSVDAARVTVYVPRLTYQDANGNLTGSSIKLAIDVQTDGGGYVEVLTDTISGKTTGKYQRSYRVQLTGDGPWDIRVRRITADSASSSLSNDLWWGSYTEIVEAKLRYPNSAICAIKFDAQQFNSIPTRAYDIKGIKVKVPYNYDPVTRTYSGVWDGTFLVKWTDNPAWIFYDLATNERYGLGQYIDASMLDKWALYQIAQYCDELVSDGFGGQEPRFTCNIFIQTREEAYKLMQNMASVFRGIMYWGGGGISATADMPTDPTMVFSNSNVIDGTFEYSGTDRAARHTVALVTWNDMGNMGKQAIEYVEDHAGIALYGVNETEVTAIGCTSRGQAHRFGRWILNTECRDTESVVFKCGIDGVFLFPGAVFGVSDRHRNGRRLAGRVTSATTSVITLDSVVTLYDVENYTLTCVLPDGSVETRPVLSSGVDLSEITVVDFSQAPQGDAQWVLASDSTAIEYWRVVSVVETDPGVLAIAGITYRESKFSEVETNLTLQTPGGLSILDTPASPTNVEISETLYQTGAEVKTQINVAWDGAPGVAWELTWKNNEDNWQASGKLTVPTYTILDVQNGSIEVRVVAISPIGKRSASSNATLLILGKTIPPVSVENFTVSKIGGVGVADWGTHADLDVRVGGKIVVRHAQETVGATWSNSVIVGVFDGNTTTGNVALMTGTYMAKARDSSGNWSDDYVQFVVTEGMASTYVGIDSIVEHPTFTGAKTNLEINGITLQISDGNLEGEYLFSNHIDLATVETRRFEADVGLIGFLSNDFIDSRSSVDEWRDIDGGVINDSDATLYAATTNDDPAGAPTWGDWTPFFVADFTCRAIKFKLTLERGSHTVNAAVSTLRVDVKVPM